jgi:hypothetical protein
MIFKNHIMIRTVHRLVMGWLVSPLVEDAELRERLWTESERLVGLTAF